MRSAMRSAALVCVATVLSGCGMSELPDVAKETRSEVKRSNQLIAEARAEETMRALMDTLSNGGSASYRVAAGQRLLVETPEDKLSTAIGLISPRMRTPAVAKRFLLARQSPDTDPDDIVDPAKAALPKDPIDIELPNVVVVGNSPRLNMPGVNDALFEGLLLTVTTTMQQIYDGAANPGLPTASYNLLVARYDRLIYVGTAVLGAMTKDTLENLADRKSERKFVVDKLKRNEMARHFREAAVVLKKSQIFIDELEALIQMRMFLGER